MYELYTGNCRHIFDKVVFHKTPLLFVPCIVTDYHSKTGEYVLVPLEDMENISASDHRKRRVIYSTEIYTRKHLTITHDF